MTGIASLEQFSTAVSDFRKAHGKTLTNCFLMPGEIAALASEGRIRLASDDGWLFIVVNNTDYSSLYYYTEKDTSFDGAERLAGLLKNEEVFVDITHRGKTGDRETPQRLIEHGLAEKYKSYVRMQLPMANACIEEAALHKDYTAVTDGFDAKQITELWKAALDEKSTPLPHENELIALAKKGELLCAVDSHGDVCAVVMLSVSGKQAMIEHLAVSPDHRRKGLAAAILSKSLLHAKEMNIGTVRLWVDAENAPAISLYNRFGFERDGMICEQLYMKGM